MSGAPDLSGALAAALAVFGAEEEERRHAFEERAAILEYDGGLSRAEAERRAAEELGIKLPEPRAGSPSGVLPAIR